MGSLQDGLCLPNSLFSQSFDPPVAWPFDRESPSWIPRPRQCAGVEGHTTKMAVRITMTVVPKQRKIGTADRSAGLKRSTDTPPTTPSNTDPPEIFFFEPLVVRVNHVTIARIKQGQFQRERLVHWGRSQSAIFLGFAMGLRADRLRPATCTDGGRGVSLKVVPSRISAATSGWIPTR